VEAHRVLRRRGSHIFLDNQIMDCGWGCQPRVPAVLYPTGRILVLIFVRGSVDPQGHSVAGRIRSIEKSNDLIGIWTQDLPACSIVPQPTMLPRAPNFLETLKYVVCRSVNLWKTQTTTNADNFTLWSLFYRHFSYIFWDLTCYYVTLKCRNTKDM
jgi:hypothetical protein